ncbi:MAG: hypothetical protein ABI640_00520 [Gammaproteobacteria bacterium]
MKALVLVMSLLVPASTYAESRSLAAWQDEFVGLSSGMSRELTEAKIAQIRGVKSTYELWAMDTTALVAYQLDSNAILLVTYKPGTPAAHVAAGSESHGHPPVDGVLLDYQVLELR